MIIDYHVELKNGFSSSRIVSLEIAYSKKHIALTNNGDMVSISDRRYVQQNPNSPERKPAGFRS